VDESGVSIIGKKKKKKKKGKHFALCLEDKNVVAHIQY